MNPVRSFREYQALRAFESLDRRWRRLVVYSEGAGDWPHIGPVIERLVHEHDVQLTYLSSDPADPGLELDGSNVRALLIGSGTSRTILFARLDCDHLVLTLPDLGNLWLKRSVRPVHYVYLFHSMNSTHAAYRKGAFDNYDTILCVGPHHVDEIRRAETLAGLAPKELIDHGSVKLDTVLAEAASRAGGTHRATGLRALVAPTWGESSLIERPEGFELVEALTADGIETVVRLHPMTVRRRGDVVARLESIARRGPGVTLERNMGAMDSWLRADVMISDWSGAALEFAFATKKPVVYVDTPQKAMNPDWRALGMPTFEARVRTEIGHLVAVDAVRDVPAVVRSAAASSGAHAERTEAVLRTAVFIVGRSASVAAEYLHGLVAGGTP